MTEKKYKPLDRYAFIGKGNKGHVLDFDLDGDVGMINKKTRDELIGLGYRFVHDEVYNSDILKWFRENYGFYHTLYPEFYMDGINFIWSVSWYKPKSEWKEEKYDNKEDGVYFTDLREASGSYGDNNEYPTVECAEVGCIRYMIELIKFNEVTLKS